MARNPFSTTPQVKFHSLPHADGSATYDFQGFSILCSVNGPIEAQRRDELPEEAFVEVILREASGTGGPRDRLLETLIHRTLLPLIHTKAHPRALIQITLQISHTPVGAYTPAPPSQSDSVLPALPHLLHAAVLALLDGNIPMLGFASAALIAVADADEEGMDVDGGKVLVWPGVEELLMAQSVHVVGFDSTGGLLLVESEGEFDIGQWSRALEAAQMCCMGSKGAQSLTKGAKDAGLLGTFRELVGQNVLEKTSWKHGG